MMTTRAVTSSPTVDARFVRPGGAATPLRRGRSDPTPRVFADRRRDAIALTWDLTVHQLHQAFGRCVAAPSTEALDDVMSQELARTRLAAARYAVDDIQAALRRMAHGTYGICQQCGCSITAHRLQGSPTAQRCATCQV
ncbi:TraR/DksA family transcriptional regulator [Micromonospora orduensis]|uniref:TraR/DksA family transcriptional regulator n=2 Tax=Micromonospora orduensis TaxID=1420891 RepID=A0A5C4QQR3_9ACTN|nr:TraR/DksA family transcriptional regulator [Micromonospora orduensis]